MKGKKKVGRPTKYTPELVAPLLVKLAEGKSLSAICKDPSLPSRETVYQWISSWSPYYIKEFSDNYARARELQMESWADDIIEIADDATNDITVNDEGEERVNHEHIQRARLRVDARKWVMSKIVPRKYGDKVEQQITGKDGEPFRVNVQYNLKNQS